MTDLELLREYEPILRFTEGELFFPTDVAGYVPRCTLLPRVHERNPQPIVNRGSLDLNLLADEGKQNLGRDLCLRLVDQPLQGAAYMQWQLRPGRPTFRSSGRLARVGLFARFVDSLFDLSLLLRGTVPGGTAAAAELQYREAFTKSPAYVYHGRIAHADEYVVLNYQFFYYMNDWRSTFSGVNDHEADWEQIFVFLAKRDNGSYEPAWVAYASHDYHGDDCRRRWDDPEISLEGTHPVVFPGAGSHSSYFQAGEYLTSVELPHVRPLLEAIHLARQFWMEMLRQGEPKIAGQVEGLLRIPFVDYARGDGKAIGPGTANDWSPAVISDETPWVEQYRGLWGLDTHDPFEGELAPSGPKYQRDGSVRQSWYDPVAWAGLDKVPPQQQALQVLQKRMSALQEQREKGEERLRSMNADLQGAELELQALRQPSYLATAFRARQREIDAREVERNALAARQVELAETIEACRLLQAKLEAGEADDPQSHVRRHRSPQPPDGLHRSRIADIWAGLSIGVLLLGGVAVLAFARQNWVVALFLIVSAVVLVENAIHRSLERLLLNVTVALALITLVVLIHQFFWTITLAAVALIALVILRDNLRELRSV